MEMTPEFKAKLAEEIKHNTMVCIREYIDLFTEFINVMEKTPDEGAFEGFLDYMTAEADEKASSPFQRFLISYILIKKEAMNISMKFLERHKEWEEEEIKKEENINHLRDTFMKRSSEIFAKRKEN